MDKPDKKFELIHDIVVKDENVLSVTELCRIAGVFRSGYYRRVNAENVRQARHSYEIAASAEPSGHECEEKINGLCVNMACIVQFGWQIPAAELQGRSERTRWRQSAQPGI